MNTSRRILLTGLAGLAVAPTAVAAAVPPVEPGDVTVAEERFARTIAAALAPVTCARQAGQYADAHWHDYVAAARAVIDARV